MAYDTTKKIKMNELQNVYFQNQVLSYNSRNVRCIYESTSVKDSLNTQDIIKNVARDVLIIRSCELKRNTQ